MCIELSFEPLTIEKWGDFVSLIVERGACGEDAGVCFGVFQGKNLRAKKETPTNLPWKPLSRQVKLQVSWSITTPRQLVGVHLSRSRYPALLRSRILQPVDDQQCWSIACLFIKKPFRKKEYQQNFYSPQLYMPKRKVQNCWKVTQLNPKLSNKFLQLLPGLVFPKHSLVRDSGKLYDVHLLVL